MVRALTALGAFAGVSVLVLALRDQYAAFLLPAIGHLSDVLLPAELARSTLGLAVRDGQSLIALDAVLVAPLQVGTKVVPAGAPLGVTTLAVYAVQQPALIYAVLAAWPCRSLATRGALLALGLPAAVVATLLDIPFVLAGQAHELLLDAGVTEGTSRSLAVYFAFLHRGGRAALAIAIAVAIALALGQPYARPVSTTQV